MIKTLKRYSDSDIAFAMKGIGNMKKLNGSHCFMIDEFIITFTDTINSFSKIPKAQIKHYSNWMDANDEFEKLLKEVINE